jgi:predicted ATPase
MIERIQIRGFKSLLETDVSLGRVNVLVGANGVGKSNLLEAIGVLGAAADGRVDDSALLKRGVRPGLPAVYKSSFRDQRLPPQIGLTASSGQANYAVHLRNPTRSPEGAWTFFSEALTEKERSVAGRSESSRERGDTTRGVAALELAKLSPSAPAAELLTALQRYRIYTPDTHTLRGLVVDAQQESPVGLSGGRLAEAVSAALAAIGPEREAEVRERIGELLDWVQDFSVRPSADVPMTRSVPTTPYVLQFRDRFMRKDRQVVSGYDASEGAVLVLFLMVLCLSPEAPPVFAVDNIDHGLNPRLARALMAQAVRWLLAGPRQALFTAHNPLVLDGLPLEDDRVRLFTVNRDSAGLTTLRRIEVTDEMRRKAKEGWSLSRMWVAGWLGGVPDVEF